MPESISNQTPEVVTFGGRLNTYESQVIKELASQAILTNTFLIETITDAFIQGKTDHFAAISCPYQADAVIGKVVKAKITGYTADNLIGTII